MHSSFIEDMYTLKLSGISLFSIPQGLPEGKVDWLTWNCP